jgi:hypothetical protein
MTRDLLFRIPDASALGDSALFYQWKASLPRDKDVIYDICQELSQQDDANAKFRALQMSTRLRDEILFNKYIRELRLTDSLSETHKIGVEVYEALRDTNEGTKESIRTRDNAKIVLDRITESVKKIDLIKNKSVLTLEVEILGELAIANCYHKMFERDKALLHSSRALGLANSLEVGALIRESRARYVHYLFHLGELNAVERALDLQNDLTDKMRSRLLAELKFRTGKLSECYLILGEMEEGDEREIARTFYDICQGVHPVEQKFVCAPKHEVLLGIHIELTKLSMKAPSFTGPLIENKLLRNELRVRRHAARSEEYMMIFAEIKSNLLNHQYLSALNAALSYKGFTESEIWKALVVAAKFETALCVCFYPTSFLSDALAEFREIFNDFLLYGHEAVSNLAELILYWTPRAAAFLGFMPEFARYFAISRPSVVNHKLGGVAYGLKIPGVFLIDQFFTSFGINLKDHVLLKSSLNGEMREAQKAFIVKRGPNTYFRPLVMPMSIAYGFANLDTSTSDTPFRVLARTVIDDYGTIPDSKSEYARNLLIELKGEFNSLLHGKSSREGFATYIANLRRG